MRTARLTDEERGARVREQVKRTSERRRQRLTEAGFVQTVFWLPFELRGQIDRIAAERREPISTVAERLLSTALSGEPATRGWAAKMTHTEKSNLSPVSVESRPPANNPDEASAADDLEQRILELHHQGLSSRQIAQQAGCGRTKALKTIRQYQGVPT